MEEVKTEKAGVGRSPTPITILITLEGLVACHIGQAYLLDHCEIHCGCGKCQDSLMKTKTRSQAVARIADRSPYCLTEVILYSSL